jgi:hypothetical protein
VAQRRACLHPARVERQELAEVQPVHILQTRQAQWSLGTLRRTAEREVGRGVGEVADATKAEGRGRLLGDDERARVLCRRCRWLTRSAASSARRVATGSAGVVTSPRLRNETAAPAWSGTSSTRPAASAGCEQPRGPRWKHAQLKPSASMPGCELASSSLSAEAETDGDRAVRQVVSAVPTGRVAAAQRRTSRPRCEEPPLESHP